MIFSHHSGLGVGRSVPHRSELGGVGGISLADEQGLGAILPGVVPATTSEEVPPYECPDPERLRQLTEIYLGMARGEQAFEPGSRTHDYFKGGGSLRLCLVEIDALSAPRQEDLDRDAAREAYLDSLLDPQGMPWEKEQRTSTENATYENYVDRVMSRISELIDADTPEAALAARQMPTLVSEASFSDGNVPDLQVLAANHLYILLDTVLKEHTYRRRYIHEHGNKGPIARVAGSRLLRTATGLAVFGLAVTPKLGVLPADSEQMAENVELGLKVLSGTILAVELPELIRYTFWGAMHRRETRRLHRRLTASQELADLTLRMTFNSTRYGDTEGFRPVIGRSGTPDPAENQRRLKKLDAEFEHMNNDPGGKPYTGDQAVGYAARLLLERRSELESIIDPNADAATRRERFMKLCESILREDLARMRKGLVETKVRRAAVDIVTLPPALLAYPIMSAISDASTLSRDTAGTLRHKAEPEE